MKTRLKTSLAAWGAALLMAGCGGGGSDTATRVSFSSLVTFGDSLSDVGTYKVGSVAAIAAATGGGGGRWTISSNAGGEMWIDRVAATFGLPVPCPAETGLAPNIPGLVGAPVTANAACLNYAQGSARITDPAGPNSVALQNAAYGSQVTLGLIAKPVQAQMAAHLAAHGGAYSGKELVAVLAGANDVFMQLAFLGTPAGGATPAAAVANVGLAGATLGGLIKTQVVGKGARYVLVLNMPDVAGTPYAKSLGATTQGLIDQMVQAFNAQLAASLAGVDGVQLGDIYTTSKDQGANPAAYGITNSTTEACGPNALSSPATAKGTALICNASNVIAGDVSHYAFADNVHPTPYGHQLIAQFASKVLAAAGWL
jgi:phospholipase/lecithinase/hemolysin